MRKLAFTLMCAAALYACNTFATTDVQSSVGSSITRELPPETPTVFENNFMFELKGKCTVRSDEGAYPLTVKVLNKSGKLNGEKLTKGDVRELMISNGQVYSTIMSAGASIELTYHGKKTISSSCTSSK